MKYPALILVDLDGVIVKSYEIHVQGWLAIMQLLGRRRRRDLCMDIRGVPTKDALALVLQRLGAVVDDETFERLLLVKMAIRDVMVKLLSPKDLVRGTLSFLCDARSSATKIACIATTTAAPEIIDRTEIRYLFDKVVYGNALTPPKNLSTQCLSRIIRDAGASEEDTLLIDDSYQVTQLAVKSGIPSLWISGNGEPPDGAVRISTLHGKSLASMWSRGKYALRDRFCKD
jgi:beta-phosphoglucomutase-like phosphatase (HAD superfamily)